MVKTRALHRKGRARVPYPVVALVGYTNAGKSTLFNALTRAKVLAKDLLFATLDPDNAHDRARARPESYSVRHRRVYLRSTYVAAIAAFRATLEEVIEADIILHVRDVSHAGTDSRRRTT